MKNPSTVIDAPALRKMNKLFLQAASVITNAVKERKKIKIRYDGDGDGICAAIMLKSAIERFAIEGKIPLLLRCQESSGAIYGEKDNEEDKATLPEGSLLILLDHGANYESKEPLCSSAKLFEIMVIDHHPPTKDACIDHFITPFQVVDCAEPSSYNTGLLVFEISRCISPNLEKQLLPFCMYSMQADTSSFRSKEFYPEAVVIDYLAINAGEPYSLEFYEKTLTDKHIVKELYREEQWKMQNALEKAQRKAKITEGKIRVVTCDVTGIARKNSYPSLGKLHNALQNKYSSDGTPTVSLVYYKGGLSFRATHSTVPLGFSANKIIEALRKEYSGVGFSGGGHNVAASTRFPKEYEKEIVTKTIEMVKENG